MPSIQSVNSNITSNTFNTVATGDNTVHAGNTQKHQQKRAFYDAKNPRIQEEDAVSYELGRSSSGSSGSSGILLRKKNIIYDLSGEKSSDELRKEMQKTLSKSNKGPKIDPASASATPNELSSWLNTILCGNMDTTMGSSTTSTVATMEKTDSESSLNSNEQIQQQTKQVADVGKKRSKKGSKKSQAKRNVETHSSARTDAALLASMFKESTGTETPKSPKTSKKAISTNVAASPGSSYSPTNLPSGAASLDIVMELQCDEDLIIGSGKGAKKKGLFRKRVKNSKSNKKPIETQDKKYAMEKVAGARDASSVVSERSLFSFASDTSNNNVPTPRGSATAITGPANGTFLNITSEDDAEDPELADTYDRYRVHQRSVDTVLNQFATSIPLYHWQGKSHSFRIDTTESACSEDLGLTSFSNLDLRSPSMTSAVDSNIPVELMNVCSEPSAKGFSVRSTSYLKDGKKSPSAETMFSLLGADSIIKNKAESKYRPYDVSKSPDSYLNKLKGASKVAGLKPPFLIIINFVVPWGNFISYYYRPDATKGGPFCESRQLHASEKLWKAFLKGNEEFRNNTLKFVPKVLAGPWALRKLIGTQPTMIGQKIPTQYFGSIEEGYLEICMDVTKGGKMANSICSAVASKASAVSIDLAFLLQGSTHKELPEQLLTTLRLHHVSLKKEKQRIEI